MLRRFRQVGRRLINAEELSWFIWDCAGAWLEQIGIKGPAVCPSTVRFIDGGFSFFGRQSDCVKIGHRKGMKKRWLENLVGNWLQCTRTTAGNSHIFTNIYIAHTSLQGGFWRGCTGCYLVLSAELQTTHYFFGLLYNIYL